MMMQGPMPPDFLGIGRKRLKRKGAPDEELPPMPMMSPAPSMAPPPMRPPTGGPMMADPEMERRRRMMMASLMARRLGSGRGGPGMLGAIGGMM